MLKKKLDDKDRIIKEKEEEVEMKEQHVVAKEKIIAEREEIIKSLTTQLEDKNKMMEEYQQSREPAGDTNNAEVSCTVKPVLSSHSKGAPKMGFITNYRLMQVKSIVECSKGSILQYFRPSLSYHLTLRPSFRLSLNGHFRQVLLYIETFIQNVRFPESR